MLHFIIVSPRQFEISNIMIGMEVFPGAIRNITSVHLLPFKLSRELIK